MPAVLALLTALVGVPVPTLHDVTQVYYIIHNCVEQVLKWREEKEQFLASQLAQEATLQKQQQLMRDKEEEKRKKKQERTKVQLSTYHREKEERQAEEEAWLESLRAETEVLKRERALLDQGRVMYRKKQAVNKISLQKKALAERAEEEREREKRLTALRQQVEQ